MSILAVRYRCALGIIALLLTEGCGSVSHADHSVHTVDIGPQISPIQLHADRGDEVRWVNGRAQPVAVIFPTTEAAPISCLAGFTQVVRCDSPQFVRQHLFYRDGKVRVPGPVLRQHGWWKYGPSRQHLGGCGRGAKSWAGRAVREHHSIDRPRPPAGRNGMPEGPRLVP